MISLPWHTLPPKHFNFQVDKFGYLASFHNLESLIITMLYLLLKSPKSGKIIGVHESQWVQKTHEISKKNIYKILVVLYPFLMRPEYILWVIEAPIFPNWDIISFSPHTHTHLYGKGIKWAESIRNWTVTELSYCGISFISRVSILLLLGFSAISLWVNAL